MTALALPDLSTTSRRWVPGGYPGALSFLAPFCVFAWTMACVWSLDTLYAIDCAEMVIAAHTLGIDHPPSHPLYLLFAHLFSQLPFALPDQGVVFTSVFFGALTAALLFRVVGSVTRDRWAALFTAGLFAFTRIFWIHSTLAEVYTVQLAFLALFLIFAAERTCNPSYRTFRMPAFCLGLGATTNVLLFALLVPCFLSLAFHEGAWRHKGRLDFRRLAGSGMWALLGAAPLVYIPIRLGSSEAFISDFVYLNGFEAGSLRWYWWYLSAEEFTSNRLFDTPLSQYPGLLLAYLDSLAYNATWLAPILAAIGILRGLSTLLTGWSDDSRGAKVGSPGDSRAKRRRLSRETVREPPSQRRGARSREWAPRSILLALLLGFLCTLIPVLSYRVPDKDVFFMPSFLFLTLFAGLGVHWVRLQCTRGPSYLHAVCGPLFLLVPAFLFARNLPDIQRVNGDRTPYEQRLARFGRLPAEAVIIGEDDGHATRYKYFQIVRGLRPDVTIHTFGKLAPRFTGRVALNLSGLADRNLPLSLHVSDRLRILQGLMAEHAERPVFAILDDRMPPEYDHYRTRRSEMDPFLLRLQQKPPPKTDTSPLPVVVRTENAYFSSLRCTGFEIIGLDRRGSQTFADPIAYAGRSVHGLVKRGELFELAFVVERLTKPGSRVFGEFAFVNEKMEIPSARVYYFILVCTGGVKNRY